MNLIIYINFYFLFIFSIIGYGYFFNKLFLNNNYEINLGYCGFYGIFSLIIISYFSNLFIAQNNIFNSISLIIGIFFFIYFLLQRNLFKEKNFFLLLVIFLILIIFILSAKTHDDFPYYHFPYIHLLTVEPTSIGIGNFNHGFRTHSSIFYLSSLFSLPIINYDLVHVAPVFFLGFANFIFLRKIIDNSRDKNSNLYIVFLSLLNLALINIFFYRIGEHGTDRSAQILILLFVTELLYFINTKDVKSSLVNELLILIFLTVSLKPFYLIYLIFIIPLVYYQKDKLNFFFEFFKNKIFYLCLLLLSLVLFTNFINTGCIVYPLVITCSENLVWAIPKEQVNHMNEWYQLWSKGGAAPNFRVDNKQEYIKYFNWVSNWINIYFFNKVFDYLVGLVVLTFIFLLTFKRKNSSLIISRKYLLTYSLIVILFAEWFYNHPALRYGGYHLIGLMIFIPLSFYLEKNVILNNLLLKKIGIIIAIIFLIFLSRNLSRISKEYNVYNYNILLNPSYATQFQNFDIHKRIKKIKSCKTNLDSCENDNIKSKILFKSNVFYIDR